MTKKEKIEELQIALISVRSEYESFKAYHDRIVDELNKTVSELKEIIEKKETQNPHGWVKYVATDENGCIYAYNSKPYKHKHEWVHGVDGDTLKELTIEQVLDLGIRVPKWSDNEPTPVKK